MDLSRKRHFEKFDTATERKHPSFGKSGLIDHGGSSTSRTSIEIKEIGRDTFIGWNISLDVRGTV
jgi:hypothetical protein